MQNQTTPFLSRPWMRLAICFIAALGLFCDNLQAGGMLGIVAKQPSEGRFVKTKRGYMVPYTTKIPGSEVEFEMLPIPGGKFKMGSPDSEDKRNKDEGPQFEVTVEPFWMGKYEVTWSEYKRYMALHDIFKDFQTHKMRPVTDENKADAITAPSNLYDPSFTFESGEDPRQPAVTITQYAAKQYTKWLSGITGDFHRLPGEAEWEYACRAGTTTAYSFGDDPKKLGDYAWHYDNSDDRTHKVGQKLPNPWGLYDMHGNVAEWVLDQHSEDAYSKFHNKSVAALAAIQWPTQLEERIVRGGTWEFDPEQCRSASRFVSADEEWKDEDPNIPLSPWWYTTSPATGVGFRIMRPLNPPMVRKDRDKFWDADLDEIKDDVLFRINEEGRGALGIVGKDLPAAIEELKSKE